MFFNVNHVPWEQMLDDIEAMKKKIKNLEDENDCRSGRHRYSLGTKGSPMFHEPVVEGKLCERCGHFVELKEVKEK